MEKDLVYIKEGDRIAIVPTDPWDFVTENGTGPFSGTVTAVGKLNQAAAVIIRLDRPLAYKGKSAELLLASTRQPSSGFAATPSPGAVFCNVASISDDEARRGISEITALQTRLLFLGGVSWLSPNICLHGGC